MTEPIVSTMKCKLETLILQKTNLQPGLG